MSGKRGSNPRPSAWEADALPTELLPHCEFSDMPKVMIIFPLCNEKMLKKFCGTGAECVELHLNCGIWWRNVCCVPLFL